MAKRKKKIELTEEDVVKIHNYIDSIIEGYSYCFNCLEPVNEKYLSRFANDRHESSCFNDEYCKLHLDILANAEITSMYELEEFQTNNQKVDKLLRNCFIPYFEEQMKIQLKKNRKIRKAEIKAEEEAEAEAKGKSVKRKKKD